MATATAATAVGRASAKPPPALPVSVAEIARTAAAAAEIVRNAKFSFALNKPAPLRDATPPNNNSVVVVGQPHAVIASKPDVAMAQKPVAAIAHEPVAAITNKPVAANANKPGVAIANERVTAASSTAPTAKEKQNTDISTPQNQPTMPEELTSADAATKSGPSGGINNGNDNGTVDSSNSGKKSGKKGRVRFAKPVTPASAQSPVTAATSATTTPASPVPKGTSPSVLSRRARGARRRAMEKNDRGGKEAGAKMQRVDRLEEKREDKIGTEMVRKERRVARRGARWVSKRWITGREGVVGGRC
jgi:hypothetical protein